MSDNLVGMLEESAVLRRESACLVPLSAGRGHRSLICVHAIHGDVFHYRHLAAALATDTATYGLQALGLLLAGMAPLSMEEIADRYVRELLDHGLCDRRFVLYGASSGGLVALEMAQRLTELRRPPVSVVLGDTRTRTESQLSPAMRELAAERYVWLNFICGYWPHQLTELMAHVAEQFWSIRDDEDRLEMILEYLKQLPDASYPLPADREVLLKHLPAYRRYLRAFIEFPALRPYAGRALYLRASLSSWEVSATHSGFLPIIRFQLTEECRAQ